MKKFYHLPSISGINRRKQVKKLIKGLVGKHKIKNLLDIGSGLENWSRLFHNGTNYHSVDLRDDVGATHVGNFFEITFKKKYDLIIGTEIIEHLPNTMQFFKRSNDLLNKDGLLLISFPFLFKIHPDPNDYYRFTLQGIKELSSGHFDVLYSVHHGNKLQLVWETFTDGKLFYPFKLFNQLLALIDYKNKCYPLGFVVLLKKKK